MIAARKTNTLVLVHRKRLLDQWVERLAAFLDIPSNQIGVIGGGKRKPTCIVDVAVIQSLIRKHVVDEIVSDYGQLIVDECHHLSAVSFEAVTRGQQGEICSWTDSNGHEKRWASSNYFYAVRAYTSQS